MKYLGENRVLLPFALWCPEGCVDMDGRKRKWILIESVSYFERYMYFE
jgi:hypothetical protein